MAAEAVAAERAYQALKRDVLSGRFAPGGTIVERTMAAEYGLSIAPFRDAAQRLVGERLLAFGLRGGYRIPGVNEDGLRDLYHWHNHLIRLALKAASVPIDCDIDASRRLETAAPDEIANLTTGLFKAIALRSTNIELEQALLAANDRLHPIRLRENRVLRNLGGELETVAIATRSGQVRDRLAVLWAYHRRRERKVSAIAWAFYSQYQENS